MARPSISLVSARQPPITARMTIDERVAQLAPWITELHVGGRRLGGSYNAAADDRLALFVQRLRSDPTLPAHPRLLECGCLEGGHTVHLARAFPDASIVACEIREENLARARLHAELTGTSQVEFVQADLDQPGPVFERTFDAVFCVGLLYHLSDPAGFIRRCAAATPRLWIWTVICAESEATTTETGTRGRLYAEPTAHVLSGVRENSMFPTLGSLCDMLWDSGYTRVELFRREMTKNGNGPAVLLYASRA